MTDTPTYNVGDVVNGHRWTGTEWEPAGPPSGTTTPAATPKKPWFTKWWGIGLIAFAALTIFGAAFGGDGDAGTESADESAASAEQTPGDKVEPAEEPAEELTAAQANALRSAESYLSFSGFSKKGLVNQLTSDIEGYDKADAEWAVRQLDVDWNQQAVRSAESYLEFTSFSRSGLINQLTADIEGYTKAQAEYAADAVGL